MKNIEGLPGFLIYDSRLKEKIVGWIHWERSQISPPVKITYVNPRLQKTLL